MRAKDALVTAAWLFLSVAAVAFGGTIQCRVCDHPVAGKFFFAEDKARGGKFEVCGNCVKLESRCFAFGLPRHGLSCGPLDYSPADFLPQNADWLP